MDAISQALTGPSARGAFLLLSSLDPPWAMRIADEAPLTVVALARGHAWVCSAAWEPVLLRAGDVVVVRGRQQWTVGDSVGTAPRAVIQPGQVCVDLPGAGEPMRAVGVRAYGNAVDGETLMLNGTYETQTAVGQHLLGSLPDLIVAPREHVPDALIDYLATQIGNDLPGQDAVLDRLLDLILIAVLRWWLAEQRHGWYRAYADPAIGRAMRLIQEEPAEPWTVARLGAAAGLSRAAFARRFAELVGEPPMTFLTTWRLSLGADLLAEPGATLAAVARKVGYSTPFAFSAAFKRQHRVSPQQFRQLSRSA